MGFGSSKTMPYMNILTYLDVLVNIKASALMYLYKGVFFFDFLINAPYFIKLKGDPPRDKKDPLTHLYITLLFVELMKIVIISIRVYKDIQQEKLVVNFQNIT